MVPDGNHVINPIPMNQVRVEVMVMGRHKPVTHDVKVATPSNSNNSIRVNNDQRGTWTHNVHTRLISNHLKIRDCAFKIGKAKHKSTLNAPLFFKATFILDG